MKHTMYTLAMIAITVFSSCVKDADAASGDCDLKHTNVPDALVGNWASGYNSSTQIVDAYSGQYIGNAFQSGKYFHFEKDGRHATFYYLANAGTSGNTATYATGTVEFLNDQSFIFHSCKAHYKGWSYGVKVVDRDATPTEVAAEGLTQKYYYSMVNSGGTTYMVITFSPGQTTGTSFRQVP